MSQSRKNAVVELLKSLETRVPEPARIIDPENYTQHNLTVGDGVQGLADLLGQVPPDAIKVRTFRVFADGDFVVAHSEYEFFGPKVGFDVFRFENDRIVEHWDNLQPRPGAPNPSGRSMLDGPTTTRDLEKTADNKALVAEFLDTVLVRGNLAGLSGFFSGDRYVQHNPAVADGLSGLGQALQAMAAQGIVMKYDRVHKILGEGDFVLAMSEGTLGDVPTAFYDLFRIEDGKIAEHWDTIDAIPDRKEWKNDNGKF